MHVYKGPNYIEFESRLICSWNPNFNNSLKGHTCSLNFGNQNFLQFNETTCIWVDCLKTSRCSKVHVLPPYTKGYLNYVSFRTVYIAYLTDAVFFGKSFFDQGDPNMSGNWLKMKYLALISFVQNDHEKENWN